ncbi:toluene tolerance protein [Coraliomargarita sp. W4R72]
MKLAEYESLTANGKVLEIEGNCPKVILLTEDRILKLFRRKRLLSSQLWITHAARFARNASKLRKRGIPTIQIRSVFSIPAIERQAVLYDMLQGDTLRDWLDANTQSAGLIKCKELGVFVAELHSRGILFRSIHFGNVVVQADGSFGLIDIADTGFTCLGGLSVNQRIRNFHHMDRHDADRSQLAGPMGAAFLQAYLTAVDPSEPVKHRLSTAFNETFSKYKESENV